MSNKIIATDKQPLRLTLKESKRLMVRFESALIYAAHASPEKVIVRMYHEIDWYVNEYIKPIATCKRGCHYCCDVSVSMTTPEAELIANKLGIAINIKDEKARTNYTKDCPFLKNKECSIYEYRPAACRVFHSIDDPQYCIDDLDHRMIVLSSPDKNGDNTFINLIYFNMLKSIHNRGNDMTIKDLRQFFGEVF